MKITSHKLVIDETTSTPQLEIVVRLPMEATQDQMAVDAQFFEKFGRDFFSLRATSFNMSIPVRFDWYNQDGRLLESNRGCFTISYGQDLSNLSLLARHLQECDISLHQKYIHPNVRYAVPCHSPDYMFDLLNLTHVLPNKFKN